MEKRWNKIIYFAFLIAIVCADGKIAFSQSSILNLDRETAASLIKKNFPQPVTYEIPIGNDMNVEDYIKAKYAVDPGEGKIVDNCYGCLGRLGYLSIQPINKSLFGSTLKWYNVSVTAKGQNIGKVVQKSLGGHKMAYVFKVCDRIFLGVSGIKQTSQSSAIVLYQWQQGDFNEVYKCMLKPNNRIETGQATLGRYDDGWRVENIKIYAK
jgi:hypothetical protein